MLTNLESLQALADCKTMGKAATKLRVTQSTISKRVSSLEAEVGFALLERDGRRAVLTPAGTRLVEETRTPLADIRDALQPQCRTRPSRRIVLGASESILASWGPQLLGRALRERPPLDLVLHAHRSPVAVDAVRSGNYTFALVAGLNEQANDLSEVVLFEERMVLVKGKGRKLCTTWDESIEVITIEPGSATWPVVKRRLRRAEKAHGFRIEVTSTMQSFAAVIQLSRAGFGHGLVPHGIARAMSVPETSILPFPGEGLSRPVSLVGRQKALSSDYGTDFVARLGRGAASIRSLVHLRTPAV